MWFEKKFASEVRYELDKVYPKLWRYCLALTRTRDLADDLAQSACLRALEKAQLYKTGTHFDRWIFRIAHRLWINEVRKTKVRLGAGVIDVEEANLQNTDLDPEMNILGREVLTGVMALPEEQRSTVYLAYVEGYTYKECAEILDIPIGTVMSRLATARAKLSKIFVTEGLEQ
jgi:RNA polymerase sigma-70 factor (ECF subfamily)